VTPNPFRALVRRESSFLTAPGAAFRRRATGALAVALLGGLAACEKSTPPAPPPGPAKPEAAAKPTPAPQTVTLIVTGGVGGQLLPEGEGDPKKGGAAEALARWVAEEKHCAGPVNAQGQAACGADATTLVLGTGDHWNGPAISSFFVGEPAAAVMARLGYAASALGNHELDFGRDQFLRNAQAGKFFFLAANLKVKDPAIAKEMELPGFKVFERKGVKVGVVGLTSPKTVTASMAGRVEGLEMIGTEEALAGAVPAARTAGADVVVVLVDTCPTELQPTVEKHPEWKLALVAGSRCPQPVNTKAGETQLVSMDRGFGKYLRAQVTVDPSKPAGERLTKVVSQFVDVMGPTPAPDAEAVQLIAGFKTKLDERLGEQIGFTKTGIKQDSPDMGRWVAGAMRSRIEGADAVIINRKGIRQGLAAGPITLGSIYSVLPFENSLLVLKLKGDALAQQLANPEALVSGFTPAGKGRFKDSKGKPLDPKKEYTVGTVEYIYFGGDGFELEKLDPEPKETGMAWQTPVIEWTREQTTSEKKPLEKALPK
jgi:5'-nucleotidase/UDP-sugar diphosphatase